MFQRNYYNLFAIVFLFYINELYFNDDLIKIKIICY